MEAEKKDKYSTIRHKGIMYLVRKNEDIFEICTFDMEGPVKVGTWTKKDGVIFDSKDIEKALSVSKTRKELIEKCECE